MDSSYNSRKNQVLFVKIEARVLELWLDMSSGPNWSKYSFQATDPKANKFFEILWFNWIHFMILEKMRSCLQNLELGFWIYGWICLLGPSSPNVLSRLQIPRSRNILRFYNFIEFIYDSGENEVQFVKIRTRVLDQWLDKSFAKGFGPKLL